MTDQEKLMALKNHYEIFKEHTYIHSDVSFFNGVTYGIEKAMEVLNGEHPFFQGKEGQK